MATSTPPRQQFSQQRERASKTTQQGYEELRAAARTWGDYIDVLTSTWWGHRRGEPAAADIIDRWFDMTHHLLDAQRQFSKSLLPMTTAVVTATHRANREAAQATADEAARATREATRTATTGPRETSPQESSGARKDS
jgi:hypothetical protein